MDRRRWRLAAPGCLLVLCALAGCQGELSLFSSEEATKTQNPGTNGANNTSTPVEQPDGLLRPEADRDGVAMDGVCKYVTPGEVSLQRLTRVEYQRSVKDLFPALTVALTDLTEDERVGPFETNTVSAVGGLMAEVYQASAEKVAEAVVSDLPSQLSCATIRDEALPTIEAESLVGTVGQATSDAWLLWSNGNVETNVEITRAADYTIDVRAWGSRAGDELPRMRVSLNGAEVQTFEVPALRDTPEVYSVRVPMREGTHTLQVSFINDAVVGEDDRNLWVDSIVLTARDLSSGDAACAGQFIDAFAPRAWRRPLSGAERERFLSLYNKVAADQGFGEGIRAIVEAGLQSPWFLYRVEQKGSAGQEIIRLSGYEMASRLSYFLWDSIPDDELMTAASHGELETRAGLEKQARRMIQDPRARATINRAFMQLLGLDNFSKMDRVPADLAAVMEREVLAFIDHIIWEGDGKLSTMLTADFAFVSPETASLYGAEAPPAGEMRRIQLEGQQRMGLLTLPAVLARYGYGQQPVHRGLFLRETFFCMRPLPPPDELVNPPETFTGQSMRAQAQGRLDHSGCGGCHMQMDPLGLVFDQFDGRGRWRDEDGWGNSLTSDGEIMLTQKTNAKIADPAELAQQLASSDEVKACMSRQWLRFSIGRDVTREDSCALEMLDAAVQRSGDSVLELFVALATTDAFRYRRVATTTQQ